MEARVRHPRLLAALRTLLRLAAAAALVGLVGVTVSFLGFVAVVSVLSLALVGDVSGMAVVLVGGAGLVALGTVGFLLVRVTGRVDRFLVRAARVPSPLERVTASYVRGEMDETELERRLERVLSTPGYVDDTPPRSVAAARSSRGGGSTHVPRSDTAAETAGLAERLVDR